MDEIEDKPPTSSTNDSKQAVPQTTFGLVTLNHFGISVRDLDRSIAFYRALTGQEPAATGTWSSTGLDSAAATFRSDPESGEDCRGRHAAGA